jgi:hypothetical protein
MRGTRLKLSAALLAIAVSALAVSQVAGQPTARSAALNRLAATIVDVTPSEDVGRRPSVRISGVIRAKPKFTARRCRLRDVGAESTFLSGHTGTYTFYPTSRAGKYSGEITLEYGGTDPDSGEFFDGNVPFSGGQVTFTVVVPKAKVPKSPGSAQSFTCRPLNQVVSIAIPPRS